MQIFHSVKFNKSLLAWLAGGISDARLSPEFLLWTWLIILIGRRAEKKLEIVNSNYSSDPSLIVWLSNGSDFEWRR